ncbi:cysteine hydrolase family protein [Phenylobacterium montanum]|uniref:Cysteine hydrolase n=1 Tax=Phenylobacterium montanum TaxID=2823693 RepID=A0A975FXQ5_9CAUL|nr:cysteine hydrolase [Caulobacter sp. S6]QUD87154.1 cysteine hydrolase [Caulobacter sp. S6]
MSGAEGLAAWIAPRRTALVIVDFQVDFASPEGKLAEWGADLSGAPVAMAAAERLAKAARRAGAPVAFVGMETTAEADSPAWAERIRRRGGDPQIDLALCRRGEPGSAFVGPLPQDGDLVIRKTRFSGFHGTALDAELRGRGIDTLVVCGMTTECCVDCTVRDAYHLDYQVFLAADACAAYEPDLHAGALKSLDLSCAILVTADQVAKAWGRPLQS